MARCDELVLGHCVTLAPLPPLRTVPPQLLWPALPPASRGGELLSLQELLSLERSRPLPPFPPELPLVPVAPLLPTPPRPASTVLSLMVSAAVLLRTRRP